MSNEHITSNEFIPFVISFVFVLNPLSAK
jgi:hypothetical protein